ncbi:hypothetical protein PPYR_13009 [Photinus pyralis]|uniref:Peroxisomal multifunctional enzyme type 2 n=1 Tax=Photinus pyralis TaxID=7054 RepID=A0A5N4A7W8_PHOPY|nr:peroxisomal multifunctional enzyme type 2-like isoform X1 [Photinus pyralis]XP_031355106.1 peroxisomal multifunctional enzyme type 2-like isoform X1 [Photinus pyralis]KAB0793389.1 hypothetical protein PPYR_13009 [Photinus pyralis]
MSNLRFNGKVAVITGAGAGLGRAYALLFASRGAKVVVNDLGGDPHGGGTGQKAADGVVNEIKQAGGTAVANYDSVTEGSKIIKTALDNYGRVDILVNNAGILRDKSFANLTEDDWDIIQNVHLKGSFKTTQAAFPVMKKQGYGRIIMTSSGSGLYGNFGQANYSAAKTGVVGLANTLAIEGAAKNVYCNVIVPTAGSRLTQGLLPEDLYQELKPELIAPVVAYLCHESCQENGTIIESAAGWAGKSQIYRSKGCLIRQRITDPATIESVQANWPEITNMKNAVPLVSLSASRVALVEKLEYLRKGEQTPTSSSEGALFTFSSKDLILYALGVGASVQNPEELKLLYENHQNFSVIPSFYILPSMHAVTSFRRLNTIPGKTISLENMLHGEQYLEIYNSPPEAGTLLNNPKIVETLDKGSGAAIVTDINSYNEQGALIMRNQCVSFAIGAGNFGGPRTGKKIVPCVPKPDRKPDLSLSYKTTIDQAALYRLSGDTNPLHIDPNFSAIAGYETPILHGLCTLGISVRLVMGAFASYDQKLFRAVKARFTKVVIPGQTLRIDMWRNGNRIHFETVVVENGTAAIAGAYVDLNAIKTGIIQNKVTASTLKSDAVFEYINDQIKVQPDQAKSVNGIFLVKITKDGEIVKEWTMDLKLASIYEGAGQDVKPNTTLVVSDDDFVELAVGKLNPQQAFLKGKLKVTGNIMLAQKLGPLLKAAPKL